jgi:hypothetical protein
MRSEARGQMAEVKTSIGEVKASAKIALLFVENTL